MIMKTYLMDYVQPFIKPLWSGKYMSTVCILLHYKSNIYCARKQQPANVSVGWLSAKNYSRENYQFYSSLERAFTDLDWKKSIFLCFWFKLFISFIQIAPLNQTL